MLVKSIPRIVSGAIRLCILTSGLLAGQTTWLDELGRSLGYQGTMHYVAIVDAGSSGSRILAYQFRERFKLFGAPSLDLEAELYKGSSSLSSFAHDPAKGADMIVRLVKEAESMIPQEKRGATPLLVRATAGLRLLPADQAQALIDHVATALKSLGYKMTSDSVSIMSSDEEGIFSWYAVNLLLPPEKEVTIATMDLGGASVQISYELDEWDAKMVPSEYQHSISGKDRNIDLFSHSYLNLGHLAARHGIFKMEAGDSNTTEFTSECVHPIVQRETWRYANTDFVVSGAPRRPMSRKAAYQRCYELARRYVQRTMDWEPPHAPRGKLAAVSFFYDVAADSGIIDVMRGGEATVSAYRAGAHRACSAPNVDQPWACLDLVYVAALLQDGFKVDDDEPITLLSKVNGHDVSWSLGMAYNVVMDSIASSSSWT